MTLLQAAGVRAMPCQKASDRFERDPQLAARGWWHLLPHPELGESDFDGVAPRLESTPGQLRSASPLLGEHTDEVLHEGARPHTEQARRASRERGVDVSGPLQGLQVVEFCDELGQLAGKLLADMGADVIKVERPGGSSARAVGPFVNDVPGPDRSLNFWYHNTNKRSVILDVEASEAARATAAQLIARADIVIEDRAPGVMDGSGAGLSRARGVEPGTHLLLDHAIRAGRAMGAVSAPPISFRSPRAVP